MPITLTSEVISSCITVKLCGDRIYLVQFQYCGTMADVILRLRQTVQRKPIFNNVFKKYKVIQTSAAVLTYPTGYMG